MTRATSATASIETAAARAGELPVALWACMQQTSQQQRRDRYLAASNRHPGKMLPELARRAITAYSRPDELVLDPMCGIGTTLVEAIHLQRYAIGIELEQRWAALASANLAHARDHGAGGIGGVIHGDGRELPDLLTTRAQGLLRNDSADAALPYERVDLVLTSPPYACEVGEPTTRGPRDGRSLCRELDRNYGRDRRNLGHARGQRYRDAMAAIYSTCARVLKPGGFLVAVTKETRSRHGLRNLAGTTIELCTNAGLAYWQHIIALHATVRGSELVARPSFFHRLQTRNALERGDPVALVAHEDVLVFRKQVAGAGTSDARGQGGLST